MLLLIDIFSINKGQGYENPSLEIIVTERCSIEGFPLEEACEHCFQNQSVIFVVVLISFLCYCGDYVGYIIVILPFLAFYFYYEYLLYLVSCNWYQRTFLGRHCGQIFFIFAYFFFRRRKRGPRHSRIFQYICVKTL
jgi:hypothetical protein